MGSQKNAGRIYLLAGEVMERPYTIERLAERWECSGEHVRRLLINGDLQGFKLGGKVWRITAKAVEAFECRTIDSEDSRESLSPSGMRTENDIATDLGRAIRRMRERRLGNSNGNMIDLSDHRKQ